MFESGDAFVGGTWTIRYIGSKVSIDIGLASAYRDVALPVLGVGIRF